MPKVYIIGAGPGDPDLITVRGRDLLAQADVVVHAGSLVNPVLLKFAKPGAALHDSAELHLGEIVEIIKRAQAQGKRVVRLASGDPTIFGTLHEHMEELAAAGIEFEVVPGVGSAGAAGARLARELTVPEVAQTVIFTRFPGRTPVPEREKMSELAKSRATMVIYLSAHLHRAMREELLQGYPPETPIAVVYKATWPDERIVEGRLADLSEILVREKITKTALVIVGDALAARGRRSRLYDAAFSHGYRIAEA